MQRHPIEAADMAAIVDGFGIDWAPLAGRTVCITGAAGFLPAYMVETMLYLNETRALGIRVLALARSRPGFERRFAHHAGRSDLVFIEQDISQPFTLDEQPDYIIHAASQASPKYYSSDPVGTLSANTLGTAALLELARRSHSRGFLYFSSSEVYGQPSRVPTAEGDYGVVDPTNVRACYAESKRMGENMCVSWHHQHGVPVKIVRPFHTYGPRMQLDDGRVYADFVAAILRGENIALKSDGLATRAFCYSADAVAGFWRVLLEGAPGAAYNIGNPDGEISMRALGQLLVGLYPEKGLTLSYVERAAGDNYMPSAVARGCPDIARAAALGWQPRTSLADGFRRTIESYL
ncbi:NAD-dependent epimerase/dehydratase family protein [Pseudoduganella sp. OTU4001]|uniref:NAD-dependent epimerase/dehydratase family protein n=1 Tax=Pseudoduganella sp. OTU4001 TaxID=3043854 RepID=UPI00313F24DB